MLCAVVFLLPSSQEAAEKTGPVTTEPRVLVHGPEMLPGKRRVNATEGVEVVPLAADDAARQIVEAEFAGIAANFDPRNTVVKFHEPFEIVSTAAKTIFPGYRFFLVAWEEFDADPKRHMLGRASDPHYFLAVAPDGTKTKLHEVPDGELLVEARIRIRSQEEVDLVWKALREIRNRRSGRESSAKVSDTEWKLGFIVFEDFRKNALMRTSIHTHVTTDADGFVTAAKRHESVVIANADPKTREKVTVRLPTRFFMNGNPPENFDISVDDLKKTKSVPLTVGANMVTGVRMRLYVYAKGTPRPEKAFKEAVVPALSFRMYDRFKVNRRRDGFAEPGTEYVVELVNEVFETDQPYQPPYTSDKYSVIWKQTLQQTTPALR